MFEGQKVTRGRVVSALIQIGEVQGMLAARSLCDALIMDSGVFNVVKKEVEREKGKDKEKKMGISKYVDVEDSTSRNTVRDGIKVMDDNYFTESLKDAKDTGVVKSKSYEDGDEDCDDGDLYPDAIDYVTNACFDTVVGVNNQKDMGDMNGNKHGDRDADNDGDRDLDDIGDRDADDDGDSGFDENDPLVMAYPDSDMLLFQTTSLLSMSTITSKIEKGNQDDNKINNLNKL